ncbi:MAG: DUF512 domain-containing protein [Firmicutes bacterium]|nr:DUF512 domain-containing protein [Bacillota bacterium]
MGGKISGIMPHSIAEELQLQPGDVLLQINGQTVKDIIDYDFLCAEEYLELTVQSADGETAIFEIEKDYDEPVGLIFASDVFDGIRTCANHCLFCFIDQLQPHPRPSLLLKDDDYRMSFLEGNFITATNLKEADFQRIQDLKLSPLYISVHSTDPKLRQELLGFKKDAAILPILRRLTGYGCRIHCQIVLCPDINDGPALEKTINDLIGLYPGVASTAVVPVGLTKYQTNPRLRLYSPAEAGKLLSQIETIQRRCLRELGEAFVYAADELYVKAGLPFPEAAGYGEFPQLENGVGMAALFRQQWRELSHLLPPTLPLEEKTAVVTGVNGAAVLEPLLQPLLTSPGNAGLHLHTVENSFYGPRTTATGLLSGSCLLQSIRPGQYRRLLLPSNMFKFDSELFLDDLTASQVAGRLGCRIDITEPNAAALIAALSGRQPTL